MDASLWQLLSSHSKGNICNFLDEIIQCIHKNTGSRICLLIAEQTDTGFVSRQMHSGKNILGQKFSRYFPMLSGEWESFVRSLDDSSKREDDAPLLEEYDFETKNQEKKSQLRKFFHNALEKKMASKGLKFNRLPWRKLCSDSESYILPGCLPYGFQLKDPELLRVEEVAELWKYIYQHQQSDELTALHFTEEVFKFDRSARDEVQPGNGRGGKVRIGKVGQQSVAPITSGNIINRESHNFNNFIQHPAEGPSGFGAQEDEISTGVPLQEVDHEVDAEADVPDNVNERTWESHRSQSRTPAHSTEDLACDPELTESVKRPKRKITTRNSSFESGPALSTGNQVITNQATRPSRGNAQEGAGVKHRKSPASDTESDPTLSGPKRLKRKASTRCIEDSSSESDRPRLAQKRRKRSVSNMEDFDLESEADVRRPKRKSRLAQKRREPSVHATDDSVQESEADVRRPKRNISTCRIKDSSSPDADPEPEPESWKCTRCTDSFPKKEAVMHRRICTNMILSLPLPPGQVRRDSTTNLFTCPKCAKTNKNSCKIRDHIKKCYNAA